jgi:hypothetical protein
LTSRPRRRRTPDRIIRELAEGHEQLAAGTELAEVCRHLEIAESTWQLAMAERLDRVVEPPARDALLNSWQFDSLVEGRVIVKDSRIDDNKHDLALPTPTSPIRVPQSWSIRSRIAPGQRNGSPSPTTSSMHRVGGV